MYARWRVAVLCVCLVSNLFSADDGDSVWKRFKAGTYRCQNSIQLYMLFDTIWEWTQVEADIDRLGATSLEQIRRPAGMYYLEMGGSALRNVVKLWVASRAILGGTNDDVPDSSKVTREITPFTGLLLGVGVGANATHAWLRRKAIHMSELDEQLFTAYTRRLTTLQKERLALVQKKLRRESMPFKLGLRLVPTRNNVWQFKNDKVFEKSSKILGCLLLDTFFTIRFRKRRADYIDTVLREAHMQYDPIKAKLDDTHQRLAGRELELAQSEAALANGEESEEHIAEIKAAVAVLTARYKELSRYEQLLRGVVPLRKESEFLASLNNDQVARRLEIVH
ncbi:MAG: hypothetical protein PVJ92_01795 [Candidatus Dependentiae bacterium]